MSTQPRLAPTRRTVLRTAAWTAPAVSIAVAAPAFATGSEIATPTATASTSGSTRDGRVLTLKSVLTPDNLAITGLTATVTVDTGTIESITTPDGWTFSGMSGSTATFTYNGTALANTATPFNPVVTLVGNPTSTVTSTIGFAWTVSGTASVTIPLAYVAPAAGIVATGTARKYSDSVKPSIKHVEWKLRLTNTSSTQTIEQLNLDFAWSGDTAKSPATALTVTTAGRTWTTTVAGLLAALSSTANQTVSGWSLAPGATMDITADFVNTDNSAGSLGVIVKSGTSQVTQLLNVGY
ncbi:hypothetical protein [Nocardioides sp. Soil805]|uniref:hypothetical protein n=1 Tax=Nocardioides sp. Soil805 TaxID=1736416 RepID=UPI0007039AC9|nr:hypothetical protein [Nocardioides sp. Soil805]KRF35042.1 hypothetical protein ASG94_12990 [Nocardioides sp. Soil805]